MNELEDRARAIVGWYADTDPETAPPWVHPSARVDGAGSMQLLDAVLELRRGGWSEHSIEELRFFEDQLGFAQVRAVDGVTRLPLLGTITMRFERGLLRELHSSVSNLRENGGRQRPAALLPTTALVPATLEHRADVYAWLTTDGIVDAMMGWPRFIDSDPPDYEEFCDDWTPTFWTDESPEAGRVFVLEDEARPVGAFMQNALTTSRDGRRSCELDLWLAHPAEFGKGYAQDGLTRLATHLGETLGVEQVFLQPSTRNPRGIRAYEKAGFSRTGRFPSDAAAHFGVTADYGDSVFLCRSL